MSGSAGWAAPSEESGATLRLVQVEPAPGLDCTGCDQIRGSSSLIMKAGLWRLCSSGRGNIYPKSASFQAVWETRRGPRRAGVQATSTYSVLLILGYTSRTAV